MDWRVEKDETVEQETIGVHGDIYLSSRGIVTCIAAGTIEEAKRKAEEWGSDEGESINNWLGKQDSFWAIISTPNPKIKRSVLHLFINPETIIRYTWKKGLIIRDDSGKEMTNQMLLIDRTTGKEIKKYVEIKNERVIRKSKGVEILGEKTPKGFALRGITLKNRRTGPELL